LRFFSKKKPADIAKPITNPKLKDGIVLFKKNKTEETLKLIIDSIKQASLLVLIYKDGLITSNNGENNMTFEVGSQIKFLYIVDKDNNPFLPVFTDWEEVDLWVKSRDNIAGWVMPAKEIFDFVCKQQSYKGIVINPASNSWTMQLEQIKLFVEENY